VGLTATAVVVGTVVVVVVVVVVGVYESSVVQYSTVV
jgi:hypothetical protein